MRPKTYMLAKAIQERKEILFGNNASDGIGKVQHNCKDKEEAWEAVRTWMMENGFANFEKKSWRDVRNHDWQYLRRSAVAKFEHNQKTPSDPIQYSEVDKIVFDIMGNEGSSFNDYDCDRSISEFGTDGVVENMINTSSNGGAVENLSDFTRVDSKSGLLFGLLNTAKNNGKSFSESGEVDRQVLSDERNSDEQATTANQQQQHGQHQNRLHSLLFNGGRKRSWDTTSSGESSTTNNNNTSTTANLQVNDNSAIKCNVGGISPGTMFAECGRMLNGAQIFPNLEFLSGLSGVLERSTASPNIQSTSRKRTHTVEDEIQEAKLQLILVQVKREEVLLQLDQAKLLQEYAKVRQENVKAELLELELAGKRKR